MDAGPLPAPAQCRGEGAGELTVVGSEDFARLVADLTRDADVVAWSEGVHLRPEYLAARNAALVAMDRVGGFAALLVETSPEAGAVVDRYVAGHGPVDPPAEVVGAVWSWSGRALEENRGLARRLRQQGIRFYGLDAFAPGGSRHGDDHRDLAVRDEAQHRAFQAVRIAHPRRRLVIFEQVEHLDPALAGSLGHRLVGTPGLVTVAAVWAADDPTVRYPLGRYSALSAWCARQVSGRSPLLFDLRDVPEFGFDAVLYAPSLSPADLSTDAR